jgi:hypothetical protein
MKSMVSRLCEKIAVGNLDECWPWQACTAAKGHGIFWDGERNRPAHAVALEVATAEPAVGRWCLHKCDNPPCCNPTHLYWGNSDDNIRDMRERRRQQFGEKHHQAKLSNQAVKDIRQRYVRWCHINGAHAIAREYGVHPETIGYIVRGKSRVLEQV